LKPIFSKTLSIFKASKILSTNSLIPVAIINPIKNIIKAPMKEGRKVIKDVQRFCKAVQVARAKELSIIFILTIF